MRVGWVIADNGKNIKHTYFGYDKMKLNDGKVVILANR